MKLVINYFAHSINDMYVSRPSEKEQWKNNILYPPSHPPSSDSIAFLFIYPPTGLLAQMHNVNKK